MYIYIIEPNFNHVFWPNQKYVNFWLVLHEIINVADF